MNINWDVERFLKRSGMQPTRFGRLAARDPRLVFDLRMGREVRAPLARRIRAFMESHSA